MLDLALATVFDVPPAIIAREAWQAKPTQQPFKTHTIEKITIHHAGVPTRRDRSFADMLRGLQSWSQREDKLADGRTKRAWPDIPYHYYISWRGEIAEARPWNVVGDTNTEYNPTGHLLICLEGNFETEEPTRAQIRALTQLTYAMAKRFNVGSEGIEGHLDFSKQTTCPGKNLYNELEKIRWRLGLLERCAPQKNER